MACRQFSGLDPLLNAAAQAGAVAKADPAPPGGYQFTSWGSIFALDYTPLGADFAWMYDDGWGGTNLDCSTPSASGCWGHRDNILGNWTTNGSQTAELGDGDTSTPGGAGQYAQLFVNEKNPPVGSLVDTLTPSSLPTPSTSTPPDVVQVSPASSPNTAAGTPVTIEGNYFGTDPQVFFGGQPATNVHVNWDGELVADAPADPLGTATDQVVVTVTTTAGTSSSNGLAQVNEFTYAPTAAPDASPRSRLRRVPQIPSGTVTINGSNFYNGGVAPIVDFGSVASIGSMTWSNNQITATIPPAVVPGTVNITVTTSSGTSTVSSADLFSYTGTGSTSAPAITSSAAATFSSGSANVFDVTTTGTPGVSSLSDTAFSGCTPSTLPSSITLVYSGGSRATLQGKPQPGDGGTYTVCLTAANGVSPEATQVFTLTVDAPAAPPPPPAAPAAPGRDPRLLAGGFRWRHLQLRLGTVLRLDRFAAPAAAGGGHHTHGGPRWVLAGGLRWRDLRLRGRGLPWVDPRRRAESRPVRACRTA